MVGDAGELWLCSPERRTDGRLRYWDAGQGLEAPLLASLKGEGDLGGR